MGKSHHVFLLLIILGISACFGDDDQEIGPEWRFEKITFLLDGSELHVIEVPNIQIRMTDSTYSYFRNSAAFAGEWEINGDQTVIAGSFEGQTFEYPLISRSGREIVFQANLIDLTRGETTNAERLTLQLLSQRLNAEGKNLNESLSQGQFLEVHYSLANI